MSGRALTAISVALGVFYVFFGTLKLAPIFSEELYRNVRKHFVRMFQQLPLSNATRFRPNPHFMRRMYGTIEVVGGIVLASCPGVMQDTSNVVLLSLMISHLFVLWGASEGFKEASNPIVLCLLLVCRFIIKIQLAQKSNAELENNEQIRDDIRARAAFLKKELDEIKIWSAKQCARDSNRPNDFTCDCDNNDSESKK